MVNNFKLLKTFCAENNVFASEDDFLFGQLMIRKKDGSPFVKSNNRIIKDLAFRSLDDFDEKEGETVEICNILRGRAYLNVNPKSFKRVTIEMAGVCLDYIRTGGEVASRSAFATASGRLKTPKGYWVIDIDDLTIAPLVEQMIPKVALSVPTVSGIHLLTKGFDLRELRKAFPEVDIHKNNPTLLYSFK